MMLNSLLILPENNLISIPENNLISTVADNGKSIKNKIDALNDNNITKKYRQLNLFIDFQPDNQQRLIDNNLYYTRTKKFIELLENVRAVYFDHRINSYKFNPFIECHNSFQKSGRIGNLLGYTIEGMVVRECNSDVSKNAKWANIARFIREDKNTLSSLVKKVFWYPFLQNPNNYNAIGTGLLSTKNNQALGGWFDPQNPRDICWIDSATKVRELLVSNNITTGKRRDAGIQLKVSTMRDGYYVTKYFKNQSVHTLYPVVYFDLGDDFYKVKQNLLNLSASDVKANTLFSDNVEFKEKISRADIVDMMLYRGRDVDESLHEELLYYKSIFHKLAFGKISFWDLINNDKVIYALIIDYVDKNVVCDSPLLTIPYI
ncbi:hypothetical protein IQ270_04380 [Microcoleus sp. LEGE 07076]|uniref:hypothetical protein n=1 Tax=Microcoleus sp. LEGE 07076 TaxID=915322 RepID=UPI00187ED0AD|nr:hypothetical protein [Microcoleus sp. LEGE 07076]MBE9183979.1 hypothetical protein [Microcoleus sp. LEGE 07076]